MNKNKRFFLSVLAFSVALAVVSCKPLTGRAVEIDAGEQFGIYDYLDASGQNLNAIDFRLDSDEDGNRSVRLQIFGLQQLALLTQTSIYDNMDFSIAPDSVTVSGSASVGFYIHNGERKTCTVFPPPIGQTFTSGQYFTVAQSEDFQVVCRLDEWQGNPRNYSLDNTKIHVTPDFGQVYYVDLKNSTFFKEAGTTLYQSVSFGWFRDVASYPIPTFSDNSNIPLSRFCYTSGSYDEVFCGQGASVSLPSGSSDTSRPWDYYNNTLLPYLRQTYPTYTQYFIFPDGYNPLNQPTTVPVEYPTLPGFDYALETNGTEPPTEFNYNIPDLPGKNIAVPSFDFTQINPAEIMAPVANGLTGLWSLITGILTEYNLFPYVAIAVLAAIVAGLMHLGK